MGSASNLQQALDCLPEEERVGPPCPQTVAAVEIRKLDLVKRFSINDKLDALRKRAKGETFVAGGLALAGQTTVFFAGPNTGKTLLMLRLLSEAASVGAVTKHVYHINLDDTFSGQIEKAELGNQHGFFEIVGEDFPRPRENFAELVDVLVAEGSANEAVFLLDTIKKFADPMDKKDSSNFMSICRKFTSAGGTIIALHHVNKNRGLDERAVPAGTSDILDDCDCGYILDIVEEVSIEGGTKRTVRFHRLKSRGKNPPEVHYQYTVHNDGDYERMFYSVRQLDPKEEDSLRREREIRAGLSIDEKLINAIRRELLSSTGTSQGELVELVTKSGQFSRRKVVSCLKRWDRPQEDGGQWKAVKGQNNSNLYQLHV